MTSQQGATFGRRLRFNSWFLGIGRNNPVEEVSPSPHHSCGIYFLPTSDFSTMNINFSGRDLKLIICNSLFYVTEDLCLQCELYNYYYLHITASQQPNTLLSSLRMLNPFQSAMPHRPHSVPSGIFGWYGPYL